MMDEEDFAALQERLEHSAVALEQSERLEEATQVAADLRAIMMLARRYRRGLEDYAYENHWRRVDAGYLWTGPGFGSEMAHECIMGWGLTYSDYSVESFSRGL